MIDMVLYSNYTDNTQLFFTRIRFHCLEDLRGLPERFVQKIKIFPRNFEIWNQRRLKIK